MSGRETEGTLALSGPRGFRGALLDRYLGLRRRRGGALIIVGLEGERESALRAAARSRRALCMPEARSSSARRPGAPGTAIAIRGPTSVTL